MDLAAGLAVVKVEAGVDGDGGAAVLRRRKSQPGKGGSETAALVSLFGREVVAGVGWRGEGLKEEKNNPGALGGCLAGKKMNSVGAAVFLVF